MTRVVGEAREAAAGGRSRWFSVFTAPRMFLPVAWILGTLYAVVTPPFQVPDEFMHFYRAYQVSEGRLTAYMQGKEVGGELPASLRIFGERVWGNRPFIPGESKSHAADIWASRTIPLDPESREFFVFGNVSWHSPTNYFSQAAGILLARKAGLGPMGIFYAGRLGNLLGWSLLVYFSLRLIPICDWTMFLLALTPMCLAQAASLSADATVNGVCFLFVAAAMRCAMGEGPIRGAELVGITFLGAAVALAKTAYLPLAVLFLLIPASRFGKNAVSPHPGPPPEYQGRGNVGRRYWGMFAIFMAVCLATIVGWSLCTFGARSYSMANVSPHDQAIYMLRHPLLMVHMEVGMLVAVPFISSIIGQLGWHDIRLWFPATVVYFAVLFWTTQIGGWPKLRLSIRQRMVLAVAALGCWVAAFSLIYLTFTPVGGTSINGLQGRYMIPATAPFFLMFYGAPRVRRGRPEVVIAGFAAVFSVYALMVLARRFYIW